MDPVTTTIATEATKTITTLSFKTLISYGKKFFRKKPLSIEEIKKKTVVLFVDDEDFSSRLNTLRHAGWNVRQVADITNYDSEDIKQADIIFMDYIGVGITLSAEQGIGLLESISKRYPNKFLIFYSGQAGFTVPGHKVHSIADDWIDKHADPNVYIDHIEAAARKIHEKN